VRPADAASTAAAAVVEAMGDPAGTDDATDAAALA